MATKAQVLAAFEQTGDYELVARRFGIPPGQAYMIATGLPADGSDSHTGEELERPGALAGATQQLVTHDSEPENPTTKPHVHRWVKERAELDTPMRLAAEARDAAPGQPLDQEETDVATVLTRDHDQVTAMLKQVKTIPGVTTGGSAVHLSRRKSIIDMITVALSQHEATEQEYFWPEVRRRFDDGDEVASRALGQEQEGKDLLQALGRTEPSEKQFDELCVQLDEAARKHVAYEDRVLLRLRDAMPLDERRQLGDRFRKGERRAPTRPHPHAPTSPGAAVKAAGAVAASLDAVRDSAGERPAQRRGKAAREVRDDPERDARRKEQR